MRVPPPRRRTPAVPRPAPVVHSLDTPGIEQLEPERFQLPDGTILARPAPRYSTDLHRFDWVAIDGWAYQINELRERPGGGKYVHLNGSPRPLSLDRNGTLPVFATSVASYGRGE